MSAFLAREFKAEMYKIGEPADFHIPPFSPRDILPDLGTAGPGTLSKPPSRPLAPLDDFPSRRACVN